VIEPEKIIPAITHHSTAEIAVTHFTLRFMFRFAGLPAWVPGTISPSSPWVRKPTGRAMNSTMNQITA